MLTSTFRDGRNTKASVKSSRWRLHLIQVTSLPIVPSSTRCPTRVVWSTIFLALFISPSKHNVDTSIGTYCGLCGKDGPLRLTKCCNRPVCDDYHKYKINTFSRVSCSRNHERYTVCGNHHREHHNETCKWQECHKCRQQFSDLESYVGQGTSYCNFAEDQWDNAPAFTPTHCAKCGTLVKLNSEDYTRVPDGRRSILCDPCGEIVTAEGRPPGGGIYQRVKVNLS